MWVSVIICNRSAVVPKMMVRSSSVSGASANMEPSEPDDEVPVEAVELELEDDKEDESESD